MSNKNLNLGLIINGCKRGNRSSQERLYAYFHPYALSICLRYAKNRQEALEIMNDGFLKVFNNLEKYDTAYPFQVWLRRILINTSIDYHRKYHKDAPFLELKTDLSIEDQTDNSDFEIDPSINTLPILQQLSPAYRMVFNLYVMEGYKHHEIAEQLGISVSTSKTNLARAKARLKTLMLKKSTPQMIKNR